MAKYIRGSSLFLRVTEWSRDELGDSGLRSRALREWLHAVAVHAGAMRGLVATELLGAVGDSALAGCHDAIRAVGSALLSRAAGTGATPQRVDIDDVLTMVNAVAWACEQLPEDGGRLDRLLALATGRLP